MNRRHLGKFIFFCALSVLHWPTAPGPGLEPAAGAAWGSLIGAPTFPHILVAGGTTTRVSVASDGTQSNDVSHSVAISADGRYVAFASYANILVPGDTNTCPPWEILGSCPDVFVHDNQTGETSRVSVDSDGTQGNDMSFDLSMSADGRYVAYVSEASNLVPGDTNDCSTIYEQANCFDVFVHDRQTANTERVSVASDGTQANGGSLYASLSADGRYVAFASAATNLVSGDTAICHNQEGVPYNCTDIFVHDRQTGQTSLVSVDSNGIQANEWSGEPVISADGRYISFASYASNLVPNDNNGEQDVFVHDRHTGETTRVSVASDGTESTNSTSAPSITADGRLITFTAFDGNLVPDDANHAWDVFMHDCQTGETGLISVATDGSQGNGSSTYQAISADGLYVVFVSSATNLIPGDTGSAGVVVRSLQSSSY